MVVHLRVGWHTACGMQIVPRRQKRTPDLEWVDSPDDADCAECVTAAPLFTNAAPESPLPRVR